ncbi:hypothetical protein E2C01_054497 [Portunus trituberculatus]|uniref:Uncharacterized protein n=1 Tax=Portunus trituberculatus TaxID=210409 RepID=A0A5B7GNT7_PORTR|nr:hypothetical protein [Portunus trituberculatus]
MMVRYDEGGEARRKELMAVLLPVFLWQESCEPNGRGGRRVLERWVLCPAIKPLFPFHNLPDAPPAPSHPATTAHLTITYTHAAVCGFRVGTVRNDEL